MSGYVGNDHQQRLQQSAEERFDEVQRTPGAFQAVRMMGCDDLDALGFNTILDTLRRDQVFGFRLLPMARDGILRAKLADAGYRLDTWSAFVGDRAAVVAAAGAIIEAGVPAGFHEIDPPTDPTGDEMIALQAFIAAAGVAPFSGTFMAGLLGMSRTVTVAGPDGELAAAAHCYRPHNAFSVHHGHAWGGLVAVAPKYRGKGLGNFVNALMAMRAFRELGATHLYELVSASNVPSARMVEASGLRHDPDMLCGIATPVEATKFTR